METLNLGGKPAVIVIRHGMDNGKLKNHDPHQYDDSNTEVFVDGKSHSTTVDYFINLLCPKEGYEAGCRIKNYLPEFLNDIQASAVSEVISLRPSTTSIDGTTPNPLTTITPFVQALAPITWDKTKQKLKLSLYTSHDYHYHIFGGNTLTADEASKVICWEKAGMWDTTHGDDRAILTELVSPDKEYHDQVKHDNPNNQPTKGISIYVFYDKDEHEHFKLQRYDCWHGGITACGGEGQPACKLKNDYNTCTNSTMDPASCN